MTADSFADHPDDAASGEKYRALRESEERMRTLADSVPQIIWANSGDGTANCFNRRWFEYTGLSFEQSAGLGWQVIVHPDDALANTGCAVRRAPTAGSSAATCRCVTPRGASPAGSARRRILMISSAPKPPSPPRGSGW